MGGITSLLNPLADLVAWVIMHLHAGLGAIFGPASGAAWGLSIVILVVIIRLLLVPLFIKQVNAQRKMAQHAPQLQELRKKFKNDKQRLNEETMKYYKENGVNPLAGCLPLIPQMIIFFSLFYVLRAIAEWKPGVKPSYGLTPAVLESAQRATIFGVHLYDKLLFPHTPGMGAGPSIVAAITVVLSATTTFMTVRQSAKRGLMQTNVDPDNPMAQSQKYMQYIVPFFSLTGLYWQYGLVLYWVTTNVWTLGQQFFMFRNWTVEAAGSGGPGGPAHGAPGVVPAPGAAARAAHGTPRPVSGARAGSGGARAGGGRPAPGGARAGQGAGTAGRDAAAARAAPRAAAANGQNGAGKRGLLRLGRPKQAPPPPPEEPVTKVVRQQPVRQARSKRSGRR
ncbi:MAG TPA: membrane protein insertase YidC [Streptosporangiaceae bacterium]|nr:membrane protein insertase YidC [Streptosporangiaceae bacterium]